MYRSALSSPSSVPGSSEFDVRALLFVLGVVAAWLFSAPCAAQQVNSNLWGTDGSVNAVARLGNTLYIGGYFNVVGTPTGGGVPLDASTGAFARRFPRVCGSVDVAIPDGAGGWFIGGYFSFVEGEPRANLAHVLADGRLADWAPTVWGESRYRPYEPLHPAVHALALRGRQLFVGGTFSTVNGQPRNNLAVLDAQTGTLLPWNPNPNGEVRCFALHGPRLFIGGYFTTIGDSARAGLAEVDAAGTPTNWNPGADRAVLAMAIARGTLYVGGQFDRVAGEKRNSVAAFDLASGLLTTWDPALGPARAYVAHGNWIWPFVGTIDVHGNTVFIGGWFETVGGQPRTSLAAVDAASGRPTPFDAHLDAGTTGEYILANTLTVHGNTVYVGGRFLGAGGQERTNLAAVDARSGLATSWNPRAAGPLGKFPSPWDGRSEGTVVALAASGNVVYAGGTITNMYDWQPRGGLAAIDLTTGRVTPWSPTFEGLYVQQLAAIGNTAYVTGYLRAINGETRENCGAVDATSGALLPWNPGNVYTLATQGDRLFVGGFKNRLTGLYANYVAPMNAATGITDAWITYPDRGAETILATDDAVYVGGDFWNVQGAARRMFAALEPATGALLPWAPAPVRGLGTGHATFAIVRHENVVYLSGRFIEMGGVPRSGLAAVDAHTGDVLPWAPKPDDLVLAMAQTRNTVWAGGRFATIDGQSRQRLAALDATIGTPSGWDAQADGEVTALLASGDTLFAGGSFRSMRGFPRGGVAMIVPTAASAAPAHERVRAPIHLWTAPNPLRGSGVVRFTLPEAGAVELTVFDLAGRRVQTLLDDVWLEGGAHNASLRTTAWPPGIYLCRLRTDGRGVVQKILVMK